MHMKKGQGASEYLVLLAVVLIVSLVAIALLGGFADVGGGAMESESKQYWTGSVRPFTIQEYTQIGDTAYLKLKNMEPFPLRITNFTLRSKGETPADVANSTLIAFSGGATKTITVHGLTACNDDTYDFFEYEVNITYSSGDLSGKSQFGEKTLAGRCVVG
jgi:hypothetical protein